MKRLYYALLLVCISIFTFNCQKEISIDLPGGPTNPGNNQPTAPITATLQGNILDEVGKAAAGVTIKVGTKTATTNARGYFRIYNASLDKNASVVTAEKTGYFKAYRTFNATSGVNQVVIQLIKRTLAGSVNTGSGGTVTLANGGGVTFPANSIVKAGGGTYSGNMKVYASFIDPSTPEIGNIVPGSFLANDKDNNRVVLTSYGMMAVELESDAGEKLQIASGKTATLSTPIPASLQATAPATIPLWFVDEATGVWKEEGTATKNGNNYIGDVKHFTYWNCDVPGPTINLTATFVNSDGLPLTAASIFIRPTSNGASAHGYTDSLGQISDPVPANVPLVLQVMSPCNTVMYSQNIGPFSANADIGTITVNNSPSLVTVKGKLVNCSGAAVTNGYAKIIYGNFVRYESTNSSGEFESVFYSCAGMPGTCEVYGVDITAQQQGATVNLTVTSPITDAGNLAACGTSSLQYINYNIDGNNYNVSSLVAGDIITGYYNDSLSSQSVHISSYHSNTPAISFAFDHTSGIGGIMTYLFTGQLGLTTFVSPIAVVITNNATAAGQFYEGSFTGEFKDSGGVTRTISSSFRVRREN